MSCWRSRIGVLLTALGMDTGEASKDVRGTMGVLHDNEKGVATNNCTRRYRCLAHVEIHGASAGTSIGHAAASGNHLRKRFLRARAGASTACHEHHPSKMVIRQATARVAG